MSVTNIDTTLNERGARYGTFQGHAEVTQHLKAYYHEQLAKRGKTLEADQYEALDMVMHKIGRIVNGDPDYADSWVDVAGYAKLVADRVQANDAFISVAVIETLPPDIGKLLGSSLMWLECHKRCSREQAINWITREQLGIAHSWRTDAVHAVHFQLRDMLRSSSAS